MKCFSERLHNPYRGIANVIDTGEADAVSRDGLNWVLYVRGEIEEGQLIEGQVRTVMNPDTKYGSWNKKQGLQRAPIRAVRDERVEYEGERLLETLINRAAEVPFPLIDHYEQWLLDAEAKPMALVNSVIALEEIQPMSRPAWIIGEQAKREFCCQLSPEGRRAAEVFERLVNEAAGQQAKTCWFRRWPDGSGQVIEVLDGQLKVFTELWPAGLFPNLLLRSHWPEPGMQNLYEDFIQWQSPYLLQLQGLHPEVREELEMAALQRASSLAECHHLIPEWVDRGRLHVVLVEAEIRRSAAPRYAEENELDEDVVLHPFFNE